MKYKEIIEKNHCGYNKLADYDKIVLDNKITESDLDYFKSIIREASESQIGYASFSDLGGIDISAILLAEVKRLRAAS